MIQKKLPLPATEILKTWADTSVSKKLLHFDPQTNLTIGIRAFVDWYKAYTDSKKFHKKGIIYISSIGCEE